MGAQCAQRRVRVVPGGVLADLAGVRIAIALAGLLILATPLALPRRDRTPRAVPEPAPSSAT